MNAILRFAILCLAIFACITSFALCSQFDAGEVTIYSPSSCSKIKAALKVEIARTPEAQNQGLSGRKVLPEGCGMLFLYSRPGRYFYWMKNMRFPLDFIWINDTKVMELTSQVAPPPPGLPDSALKLFCSTIDCDKVLEVPGGFIARHRIVVGDRINLKCSP